MIRCGADDSPSCPRTSNELKVITWLRTGRNLVHDQLQTLQSSHDSYSCPVYKRENERYVSYLIN